MNIARNGCQIHMFQGGPLHESYFIAINNREQVIIGPGKKIVTTHVIGELEVWILKWGYYYDWCLLKTAWRRAKGMTIWLAAPQVVSVSISCSRCYNLTLFLLFSHDICFMYYILCYFWPSIYNIDTILYSYTLPLLINPLTSLKSLPKCNLSFSLRS